MSRAVYARVSRDYLAGFAAGALAVACAPDPKTSVIAAPTCHGIDFAQGFVVGVLAARENVEAYAAEFLPDEDAPDQHDEDARAEGINDDVRAMRARGL